MEAQRPRAELDHQHLGTRSAQAVKIPQQVELVDEDAMSQIRKGHDTMCVVLTSRHKNLDTVRAVWTTGDIKASPCPPGFGLTPEESCTRAGHGAGWPLSPHGSCLMSVSVVIILMSCH